MHYGRVRAFLSASLIYFTLSAQSPPPAPAMLPPQGPWVVDYADTQCSASRKYTHPDGELLFAIRPSPNGETYELIVAREHEGPRFAQELEGSVDFGRGPNKAWLLRYRGKGKNVEIRVFRISAAEMATARAATFVKLQAERGPDLSFGLDHMGDLLSGLDTCTKDLKQYWNIDSATSGNIAAQPKGSLIGIFSDTDYPDEAMKNSQEGSVQFLLLIDEKGAVAGCHVEKASGVPVLDAMGCQVIRERMKYSPAQDKQGRAVRSALITPPVSWRIMQY